MRISYLVIAFLYFKNLYVQNNNIDYAGHYKANSFVMGKFTAVVDKDYKAILTSINSYKYECSCKILNQNTLGCYMVKLLDGKNILNPKPGEFLFAIIYEKGDYYPFFRGDNKPFINDLPAPKLIMKKNAVKFIKSK